MIFYDLQYAHGKLFLMRIARLKMDLHRFVSTSSKTFAARDSFVSNSITCDQRYLMGELFADSIICLKGAVAHMLYCSK